MTDGPQEKASFWDHLHVLRGVLLRALGLALLLSTAAFCLKDVLFAIVLAPQKADFITYRLLDSAARMAGIADGLGDFHVELISTGLARQFMIHMKVAFAFGLILASPYIVSSLYGFIAPGLYSAEKAYARRFAAWGYLLFALGACVSYFLIFPLTFRFLGTYQVDASISNLITLDSYVGTLTSLTLALGVVFELPVAAWLAARMGLLTARRLRSVRRHAIVAIFVVAGIITPTSDVFTLMLVALPMWALYEVSVVIVARTAPKPAAAVA